MEKTIRSNFNIVGNLDTDFLKIIGIISMTLDHFGKVFFPDNESFQIMGRLAFPLFAYCIMVGCIYTKNFRKYFLRLIIPAFLYQIGYLIGGYFAPDIVYDVWLLNIFFTLALGALAIRCIEQKNWVIFGGIIIIGLVFKVDYGLYGIMLIPLFYLLRERKLVFALMIGLYLLLPFGIQKFAVFAMIPILIKTNFNFKINKYFFYIYYPAHFLIIFIIKILMDTNF